MLNVIPAWMIGKGGKGCGKYGKYARHRCECGTERWAQVRNGQVVVKRCVKCEGIRRRNGITRTSKTGS